MKEFILLLLALFAVAQGQDCISSAVVPSGYCARVWASGVTQARGIFVLPNNDVLVIARQPDSVVLFWENATGTVQRLTLATVSGLNHGVTYGGGYLYASSSTAVYRWPYTVGNRTALGTPEVAISGVPSASHSTRTLVYDTTRGPSIIVSVGSNGNVDSSGIAGLYRFNISSLPTTWASNKVVALGLRNEVGVKLDNQGRLWGVENGVDNLNRNDLGGDIHNENPGEEINLFETDGGFYGYPYCWSQYNLTTVTTPRLTQYAHPNFINDGTHTDAWCQNTANVILPKYSLRAHTAPLDIAFYSGTDFPSLSGSAFVASHGSWNRIPAAGYAVVRLNMQNGLPVSDEKFFAYRGPGEWDESWYRPVGLGFAKCGGKDCLLVTDDHQGTIIAISYTGQSSSTTSDSSSASSVVLSFLATGVVAFALFL